MFTGNEQTVYKMETVINQIIQGDCVEVMKGMADNSVDAIVTDPPYGISFMGKHWDYNLPLPAVWAECIRILKPGGHLLFACGTRTYHRMACAIEDAGFEIRDCIGWVYGQGFPKSLAIGKSINKLETNEWAKILNEFNNINKEDIWENKLFVNFVENNLAEAQATIGTKTNTVLRNVEAKIRQLQSRVNSVEKLSQNQNLNPSLTIFTAQCDVME